MTETDEPQWQPLSQLPFIASIIDEELEGVEEQWQTLQEGRGRPHVFDDLLVDRIERVFGGMLKDHWLWPEQLRRWSQLRLTAAQKSEIERLKDQADKLKATLEQILAFAKEIRPGTIDAVLRKSDLELGLEMLLRGEQP